MKTVTTAEFLEEVDRLPKVLLAFATESEVAEVDAITNQCEAAFGITVLRVDPEVANAVPLQIGKHPTYAYYMGGSEVFQVVGNPNLTEKHLNDKPFGG